MFSEVLPTEAQKMLQENKQLVVVDVREAGEVAGGTIPGAINIPLGQVLTRINEFDSNKEYLMICRSGNRSSLACEWLSSKGFQVTNLLGGMMSWDGPVE
ncbi:rhodanese-like domain-containing protein [Bacillus sp. FJAT-42315]|uniref:rhodanese-like domain-containing protein n=1 Tax=Bacillus sp. FJAT-42315 TaxID=2014077 RepID=UPI000C24E435|nr:rhodanese-like domain-containing protein [Bacillus sp. FJAT-42315]